MPDRIAYIPLTPIPKPLPLTQSWARSALQTRSDEKRMSQRLLSPFRRWDLRWVDISSTSKA